MDPDQFKDHVFPELTRQQADRFRALLHKEFRQRGIEIELMQRIVSLEFPSGTRGTIDLENLYRTLSQDPERMEELVADFVPHVLSFPETESLTDAEFYSVLKIRLMAPPAQPLPKQDDWMEWPFSKDIVVQLVQDGEHTIASLNSDVALSHGDPADLIRIGERNTWQELVDADVDVEHFALTTIHLVPPCGLSSQTRFSPEAPHCFWKRSCSGGFPTWTNVLACCSLSRTVTSCSRGR